MLMMNLRMSDIELLNDLIFTSRSILAPQVISYDYHGCPLNLNSSAVVDLNLNLSPIA